MLHRNFVVKKGRKIIIESKETIELCIRGDFSSAAGWLRQRFGENEGVVLEHPVLVVGPLVRCDAPIYGSD